MLHHNPDSFKQILSQAAAQSGFMLPVIEKDYYLTLILSRVHELSPDLVFKGGTCLNKVYFSYFRLSEDLDFSMILPDPVTRTIRRELINPIKMSINDFAQRIGLEVIDAETAGRNESKQYVFTFTYPSVVLPSISTIKFEIGLRYTPLQNPQNNEIHHIFVHPFTKAPLFDGGTVLCLSLQEVIAEKLRAAATRKIIAPRDFYDIDFIIRNGIRISDPVILSLFQQKLSEDDAISDIRHYAINLGRTDHEIDMMKSRITEELFDVLTAEERERFSIDAALLRINEMFATLI